MLKHHLQKQAASIAARISELHDELISEQNDLNRVLLEIERWTPPDDHEEQLREVQNWQPGFIVTCYANENAPYLTVGKQYTLIAFGYVYDDNGVMRQGNRIDRFKLHSFGDFKI